MGKIAVLCYRAYPIWFVASPPGSRPSKRFHNSPFSTWTKAGRINITVMLKGMGKSCNADADFDMDR